MKTAIAPAKLEAAIQTVLGDFNDEKRLASDLRDFLTVGQEVRCCRSNSKWEAYKISKVGKRSFVATQGSFSIDFIVTKYGQIYERGTTNERFGRHYTVDFDCEKIDRRMAKNEENEKKATSAIEIAHAIRSEINRITPFNTHCSISDENVEKLAAIKAILGL